ncbi:MAG TPA: NFACT RNA binding domain-containing protein [Chryseosolibacter sp.]
MHNNYYFLKKLSPALERELKGTVISECFSQNKDELIIRFETAGDPFFIKATLTPKLSSLSFPKDFHRARKNSVDLFETIIGRRVLGTKQFSNERSFCLQLSDNIAVLFKMHGNKGNVIVFEGVNSPMLFKNSLIADSKLVLNELDREIDWSSAAFPKDPADWQRHYFTFGKMVWQYLSAQGIDRMPDEEKWATVISMRDMLEVAEHFFTAEVNGKIVLSLLDYGNIKRTFNDPLAALNDFFYTITHVTNFEEQQQKLISTLTGKIQSSKNYYAKTFAKAKQVEQDNNYKVWADLIMANMHSIPAGADKVVVDNFYNENKPVEIKLRKDQSPQKNAETFYRKSKNQQIEIDKLQEILRHKKNEIERMEKEIEAVRDAQSLKQLNALGIVNSETEKANENEPLPYHEFIFKGYKIWVGKNAESNDTLTLKLSYKEDLWLHAKDVSGSHVLIKHQAGKNFPKDVIERAAELAAYNSKRKNDSLCPVIVTPKKFVRKRKGDPAGAVVVEKESVVMVVPRLS